ncbi:MAG: deoxyribonuclease IV [Bacilli bacterium]|nr:deoxyribonuclease IV [Bacilli bacterium]
MDKLYLGSHVNMGAPDYYLGTVKAALDMGENCFMFYTGAPQNTIRKPTNLLKIDEGRALLKNSGLDESKIVIHAPYIVNLGNVTNSKTRELAINFLKEELKRVNAFHIKTLVLHPGSHVGAGIDAGIQGIIDGLNEVLKDDQSDVKIALETMAGKGSEIGAKFEELAKIINGVKKSDRVGVCLDTCHISDAGYDLTNLDKLLDEFDRVIGLDKLLVIHINDSINSRGAHKDRHANIGVGLIGFNPLVNFVHHPRLVEIPKILETPWINEKPPYAEEIKMLKSKQFDANWAYKF